MRQLDLVSQHYPAAHRDPPALVERGIPASADTEPTPFLVAQDTFVQCTSVVLLTSALFTPKNCALPTSDKSALSDAAVHPDFVERAAHAAVEL
ncbi:MAG: hypothetical protein IPM35_00085 [Myxococcales bacterium]|nr:hypothetical protein [Myxococcales bacterium]